MAGNNINSLASILQGMSELQARRLLESEGKRLEAIAIKLWRRYLSSYSPKEYIRTGKAESAIKLKNVKKVDGNHLGIELTWENDLVYHDSIFGSSQKGHAVMLISDGWHSRKLENRIGKVYKLTYFEGTGYLYRVYKEYMATAPAGITLDVQWSGKASR